MNNLKNKSILFISPSFFGYEQSIRGRLAEVSARVDYFDERPANTFWTKALIRINPYFLSRNILKHYDYVFQTIRNLSYDYVLIVDIEAMPISFLRKVKKMNPQAVFILYIWDSIRNKKNTTDYFSLFDRIFSFDREDCKKYPDLCFRPLFYLNEYKDIALGHEYDYDFLFVGTAHSDRYALVHKLYTQISELGMKSYCYMFLQDRKLFYWNKLTNLAFSKAHLHDFHYKVLSKSEVLDLVKRSRIVIDIQHPKQTGLTMRTIEILGARRKLVTTNASIKEYDFYSDDNVLIIDRKNPIISQEFCLEGYKPLSAWIYHKYSLDGWLEDILCSSN